MRRFSTPAKKNALRVYLLLGEPIENFDMGELEEKTIYFWKLALGPIQMSFNKQKVEKL
jgi:hypothetical protein